MTAILSHLLRNIPWSRVFTEQIFRKQLFRITNIGPIAEVFKGPIVYFDVIFLQSFFLFRAYMGPMFTGYCNRYDIALLT
jgi:hypothetical protein